MHGLMKAVENFEKDPTVVKVFGAIIYSNRHPHIKKALKDEDYWLALDDISGTRWAIFAARAIEGRTETRGGGPPGFLGMMIQVWVEPSENSKLIEYLEIESTEKPLFVIFTRLKKGNILKSILTLDDSSTEKAYDRLNKIIQDLTSSIERIENENIEDYESVFNAIIAKTYIVLYDSVKKGSSEFTNLEYLSNLVDIITESISCIQIITNSEDSAYVLFETLNDRGLDLTLSDMLKNYIFSKAGKRIEEAKHKWAETMTFVGQKYLKTFIRHEWMSKFGHTREKELFKKIKRQIKSNPLAIEYVSNLRESAIVYDAIRNPDHDAWEKCGSKCRNLLDEILLLGTIQCYPLILSAYFSKPKELETVLQWIVSLTVRYSIICGKGTGNLETTYAKASAHMRKKNAKLKEIKEILLNIWPTDEEFKVSFVQKTLSTPRIIKYLLSKIEIKKSKDDSVIPNPDALTVEHILPKKPNKDWQTKMRKDAFLKEWVNRIGNVTILTEPMNREAQSNSFTFKKSIYSQSSYSISKDICEYSDWDDEKISERQSDLSAIASKVWIL